MKIKLYSLYSFLFVFIIFLIIYYINTKSTLGYNCNCKKKEGMTRGSMQGYIKRQIRPIPRNIRSNFTGASKMTDYYTNKLNQIFR